MQEKTEMYVIRKVSMRKEYLVDVTPQFFDIWEMR